MATTVFPNMGSCIMRVFWAGSLLGRNPSKRNHKATGQAVVTLSGPDSYPGPWGTKAPQEGSDRRVREWHAAGSFLVSDRGFVGNFLGALELLLVAVHDIAPGRARIMS
jgi:hypothetical protein